MRVLYLLALALTLALAALRPAAAQDAATLVADRVALNGDETITADGAVEVLYKGRRLRAERIVYDGRSELLTITGPIILEDGDGTVVLASEAELSRDLRNGIMESARLVLQSQMQLAANELRRVDGRFNVMTKVAASSCQVCPSNPRPLWEIRARRVIHDEIGRQLYFEDAQLRVGGVPILYLPRLRFPDPSVQRATGFLAPSYRSTSALGFGVKIPYFIALGDSRDLTLTPYLSTGRTRTLEFRYRQAFQNGNVEVTGAATRDTLRPGNRGYLFADGSFLLPRDYRLDFVVQTVSDRAYLLDYGLSDDDRLDTGITLSRTRADQFVSVSAFAYRSIRAGDDNTTLPTLVGDAIYEKRFSPALIGGDGGFRFELHGQRRESSATTDVNGDGIVDGRDVARATAIADWRRNWVTGPGIVVSGMAEAVVDFYAVSQDPTFPGSIVRVTPTAAVELRWPLVKALAGGGAAVLEPVVQVVASPDSTKAVPNEDSLSVEFDEGNLFSLNRFPGADAHEAGLRANIGLSYTRYDPTGWTLGVTVGRVLRADDLGQFSTGSGLSGTSSDWLLATEIAAPSGLRLSNRAVFDDNFGVTRDELRLRWQDARRDLTAGYIWQDPDPAENRLTDTSELTLDAGLRFADGWRSTFNARYDFVAERTARAGIGIEFRNECATFDLSLSRRFTSSTSVDPVTDFRLGVAFTGFGAGADGQAARTCRR
jgi:LPS-assembly protein